MYHINFVANNTANHGLYNYHAIGSLDQLIEGARVKSGQVAMLRDKQWIVLFSKDNETIASRTMINGQII